MAVKGNRYDTITAPEWMTTKFDKTPEGFLRGRAVVTNTGVFPYVMADGTIVRELRLPDEVFSKESLDSLRLKPVTNSHPADFITPENIKDHQVGNLGDNPSSPTTQELSNGFQFFNSDNYYLSIDMIIQEKEAIQDVFNGRRALSCGYTCDLEPAAPGARWLGMDYDYVQRNIRYNHVALVDAGRAGDAARIRLDSADAILVHRQKGMKEESMADMKVIKLDGVDYQAEPKVLEALHLANTRIDDANKVIEANKADMAKAEAERDTLKDKVDALEAKVKELEARKIDEVAITVAVNRRVRILDAARLAEVEIKDGMNELDIQKAVIAKTSPKAVLDGKDQVYIDARFDGALEILTAEKAADAETRKVNVDVPEVVVKDEGVEIVDSTKARQKMIDELKNRYKVTKK